MDTPDWERIKTILHFFKEKKKWKALLFIIIQILRDFYLFYL